MSWSGPAPERLSVKAGRATELVELVSDGAAVQPHAGAGDQEARVLRARAELVTHDGRRPIERRDRGRVQRDLSGACRSCRGGR